MRFADKVVWITGASAGIGEALAYEFHREGATLILSARRPAELERVKAKCSRPQDVALIPFDILDDSARAEAVQEALATFGHVDILVNNAGVSQRSLGKDTLFSVDRKIMELDYFSVVGLTKLLLPSMIARKTGHLVVTSSVAGKFGVPMRTAYCAAKHAVHGFFDTLRAELYPDNINVTLLVVAGVQTDVSVNAMTGDGTPFGKMDPRQSRGMAADEVARIAVNGIHKKKHDVNIARGDALLALYLARFWPAMLFNRLTRRYKH